MRRRTVAGLLTAVLVVAGGCRTTAPRVPALSSHVTQATQTNDPETRVEVSLGTVTVSTPKFTPIASDYRSGDRLDFGDLKKTSNLFEMVRKANVSVSNTYYRTAGMSLALALAGTQVYAKNGVDLTSDLSGSADPAALVQQMMAGQIDSENFPVGLAGEFGLERSASYSESFQSPDAPAAATLPTLSDELSAKLLELLSGTADGFRLDPFTEIKLVAALHNSMVNTEAFYNFDDVFTGSGYGFGRPDPEQDNLVWAPYRAQFNVAVRPGWYSQLNQFDALVDVEFPGSPDCENCAAHGRSCDACQDGRNMRVIAVVPQEGVQVIDEFTSALEQVSVAGSLAGSFKAVGLTAAYESLAAAAQRLEGFRKNTTHLVSYPNTNTARIRVRPTIVPSNQPRELQPQSMLFTAFVLVRQDYKDIDESARGRTEFAKSESNPKIGGQSSVEELKYREEGSAQNTLTRWQDTTKKKSYHPSTAPGRMDADGRINLPSPPLDGPSSDLHDTKSKKKGVRHGLLFNDETCVQYRAAFEPGIRLKNKRRPIDAPRPYYHAPKGIDDRESRFYVTYDFDNPNRPTNDPDHAWRPLPVLLPPYRSVQYDPFGFNKTPFGFFDCIDGELKGYVAYTISNPPIAADQHPPKVFYSTETNGVWNEFSMQDTTLSGAMKVKLGPAPSATVLGKNKAGKANTITDYKARFFLMIRRTNLRGEYETEVHEVILPHRASIPAGGGGGGGPVINISDKGVSAEKLPVEAITPELAAILSNGHVILHPAEKKVETKSK